MVVFTSAAVATIVTGGAAAAAGAGVVSGAVGAGAAAGGVTTGSAVAGAAAFGATTGAIAGAAATTTYTGAAVGAAAGGFGGAGVAATTIGAATGPPGWIVLGASFHENIITFDCWKAVIHDKSSERSTGMLLRDVMNHPNVSMVTMTTGSCPELPHIVIENIWKEQFEIEYYILKRDKILVCHAKAI